MKTRVHYLITALICFGFGLIPPVGGMTEYGMGVLGTFIGAIYGWSTIGMIWPSIIAMLALGMEIGMNKMVAASIGNPVVAGLLILFPMFSVLSSLKVTEWLANKFLTNKLALGRPWVGITIMFLGAFFTSFINPILVIIIFGTFVVSLTKSLGIKPYSKLATALLLGLSYSTMLGQITVPMISTGLTFSNAFQNMFQTTVPYAQYMVFMYLAGVLLVIISVLVMRFVLRVDVSPFATLNADMLGVSSKLNRDQKIAAGFFIAFVVILLAHSLTPVETAVGAFLGKLGFFGISGIIGAIMMLLKKQDGSPLLDFPKMAAHLPWDAFFLTAFILVISAFLTTPETGLNAAIGAMIAPMTKLNPWVFIILVLIFAAVVTNVANNLILTIVIMPVLYRFAALVGMDGTSLIFVLFITTQLALATPGASPITAIAMSNTSIVKVVDMMKMSFIFIPIMLVATIIVCMPLASFIL